LASPRLCTVPGCDKRHEAHGLCKKHYKRAKNNGGDPLARQRRPHGQGYRLQQEAESWRSMIRRCYNPKHHKFATYGARGVKVCDHWRNSFEAFLADMGPKPTPKHTIERIDNDGDYSPDNCKWATNAEQSRNMRTNHRITAFGRTQILEDWSRETGISAQTIRQRLKSGWTSEDAVSPLP